MVIIGSGTRRITGVSNNTCAMEFIAGSQYGFFLLEVELLLTAATASQFSMRRSTTKGVNPTTPFGLAEEGSTAATRLQFQTALAWGTPPVPSSGRWSFVFPAVVGSRQAKAYREHWVAPGESVCLWNDAANGVVDVNFVIAEIQ